MTKTDNKPQNKVEALLPEAQANEQLLETQDKSTPPRKEDDTQTPTDTPATPSKDQRRTTSPNRSEFTRLPADKAPVTTESRAVKPPLTAL